MKRWSNHDCLLWLLLASVALMGLNLKKNWALMYTYVRNVVLKSLIYYLLPKHMISTAWCQLLIVGPKYSYIEWFEAAWLVTAWLSSIPFAIWRNLVSIPRICSSQVNAAFTHYLPQPLPIHFAHIIKQWVSLLLLWISVYYRYSYIAGLV